MTYTLRVNGKTLNAINGKKIRNLIYKGIIYEIGSEPIINTLQTPTIYLESDNPEISTIAILGKAILGYAILGKGYSKTLSTPVIYLADIDLETLTTPTIYLESDEILETLDTPIIRLESDEPEIQQLTTPSIYLEIEEPIEPDEPIITQLDTPTIYFENDEPEVVTHTFEIIPVPYDAKVTFAYKGEFYVKNSIVVNSGDTISWEVSAEGYASQTSSERVTSNVSRYIILTPLPQLSTPHIYYINNKLTTPTIYLETI